jgi:hypothetical protein
LGYGQAEAQHATNKCDKFKYGSRFPNPAAKPEDWEVFRLERLTYCGEIIERQQPCHRQQYGKQNTQPEFTTDLIYFRTTELKFGQ